MANFLSHQLILLPILLPFCSAILLFALEERHYKIKARLALICSLALLFVTSLLFISQFTPDNSTTSYPLGNWPAPFGIVLVLDKLSALMLLLTSLIGILSLTFARAYWDRMGHKFHAFMQFLFMGMNGVVLTGDLFNLFVFFEIMLAASYALALHSFDKERAKFSFHYVVLNLIASIFFLIGTGLIYSATGTLNFADLALKTARLNPDRFLYQNLGFAFLGLAFLTKIGMWPINFWLAPLYSRVPAPIGAIFVLLSKIGFYILLRLAFLLWPMQTKAFDEFGQDFLFLGGICTLIYGSIALASSINLRKIAAYSNICSAGILLICLGFFDIKIMQAALYYMVSSIFALSAFFLLTELTERLKVPASHLLTVHMERGEKEENFEGKNLGLLLPKPNLFIGIAYSLSAMLLIGIPPLSGFLAKFTLIYALLLKNQQNLTPLLGYREGLFMSLLLLSSFFALIVFLQKGMHIFWTNLQEHKAKIYWLEFLPILILLICSILLTIGAPLAFYYFDLLTHDLNYPLNYIENVLMP